MYEAWTLEPDSLIRGESPDKEESSFAEYCLSEPSSAMISDAETKLTPGSVHMSSISLRISVSLLAHSLILRSTSLIFSSSMRIVCLLISMENGSLKVSCLFWNSTFALINAVRVWQRSLSTRIVFDGRGVGFG